MLQGKDLILATKPYAREHRPRSWWHLASTVAVLTGLLTFTCLDVPWWARLPCSILAGLVLIRLFVLYHDYLHGAILSGSWLAEGFFKFYGLLVLAPASIWRHTHDHHHHHNGQYFGTGIGTFRLMTTDEYARASRWQRLGYFVERHAATIFLGYVTIFLISLCLRYLLTKPGQHLDAAAALLLQGAVVTGLAILAPQALFFTFLVPMSLAAGLGSYLFYAQHNFPGARYHDREDWDYVSAALESSSYLRLHPIMHWFTGNIGYHHVHHVNSRIPFYRLPEAMAGIKELQSPGTTSLWPVEIGRCLRLYLWDPRAERLVTRREGRRSLAAATAGT